MEKGDRVIVLAAKDTWGDAIKPEASHYVSSVGRALIAVRLENEEMYGEVSVWTVKPEDVVAVGDKVIVSATEDRYGDEIKPDAVHVIDSIDSDGEVWLELPDSKAYKGQVLWGVHISDIKRKVTEEDEDDVGEIPVGTTVKIVDLTASNVNLEEYAGWKVGDVGEITGTDIPSDLPYKITVFGKHQSTWVRPSAFEIVKPTVGTIVELVKPEATNIGKPTGYQDWERGTRGVIVNTTSNYKFGYQVDIEGDGAGLWCSAEAFKILYPTDHPVAKSLATRSDFRTGDVVRMKDGHPYSGETKILGKQVETGFRFDPEEDYYWNRSYRSDRAELVKPFELRSDIDPMKYLVPETCAPQPQFAVGDYVKPLPSADSTYSITNSDMTLGKVVGVRSDKINVQIVEHKSDFGVGDSFWVDPTHFEKTELVAKSASSTATTAEVMVNGVKYRIVDRVPKTGDQLLITREGNHYLAVGSVATVTGTALSGGVHVNGSDRTSGITIRQHIRPTDFAVIEAICG